MALDAAVRSSWSVLDRYRRMRAMALADLGAEWLRERHHRMSGWLERLIDRGRLVTMVFSILHTGADEVNAGRLADDHAADILAVTVLSVLRPDGSPPRLS